MINRKLKLQAEAEQLYPYPESSEAWWLAIIDVKRAAHVACAEKYTAEIDRYKAALKKLVLGKTVYGDHPLIKIAIESLHPKTKIP